MKRGKPPAVRFKDGVVSVKIDGVTYKFKDGAPYLDTILRVGTEDYEEALSIALEWEYE